MIQLSFGLGNHFQSWVHTCPHLGISTAFQNSQLLWIFRTLLENLKNETFSFKANLELAISSEVRVMLMPPRSPPVQRQRKKKIDSGESASKRLKINSGLNREWLLTRVLPSVGRVSGPESPQQPDRCLRWSTEKDPHQTG